MAPPENLLQSDPQYQEFIAQAEAKLSKSAQLLLVNLLTQLLSEGDILILSLMGVDGRQKILDVFIKECQKLKEEFKDD